MPPQFCPISFTLFLSIKGGGKKKHIPFWCTSEGTQTPHQVVLITGSRPYRGVCQWPPSLGPTAAGLCTPDKRLWYQPPTRQLRLTPSSSSYFTLAFFPSFRSPLVHPLYMQSSALSSPTTAPSFHPPLFPNISVPSSFPPVIRSRWPPAGVNGGENQPEVSGCISSLRCSLAVMRTGTVKAPFPAARDTHGGIMSCMSGKRKKKHLNFCFVPPPVMYSVCGYCAWCLPPPLPYTPFAQWLAWFD